MIYCIHDDVLKLKNANIRENDILTFDDAHYNVYKYREFLKSLDCRKILFITCAYVDFFKRVNDIDDKIYYQYDYHINHNNQFLNIYEIEDLLKNYNFELGMHSYFHDFVYVNGKNDTDKIWRMYKISTDKTKMKILNKMYAIKSKLVEQGMDILNGEMYNRNRTQYEEFIKSDTFMCVDWFKHHLYVPNRYAYPFFENSPELDMELDKYNIKERFGKRQSL